MAGQLVPTSGPPVSLAEAFATAMLPHEGMLERAIEWIADFQEPGDVFPREKLEEWARLNGWSPPA